jgi:hypothetical protein
VNETTSDRIGDTPVTGTLQLDGSARFAIDGILPGRYLLHAADAREGDDPKWSLVSATARSQDVLDVPIDLGSTPQLDDIELTLSDRPSTVAGTVSGQDGARAQRGVVIVFPADERYWWPRSRRVRTVEVDHDGRYRIRDLPASEYVAAYQSVPDEPPNPDFAALRPLGIRFTIRAGEQKELNLRLAPR